MFDKPISRVPGNVGRNVKNLRRLKHWSQVELARRLGMRPGPVNCIEKGRNLPSARVLCKLAEVLDVSLDALFAGEGVAAVGGTSAVGTGYVAEGAPVYGAPCALWARTDKELADITPSARGAMNQLVADFLALEDLCGVPKRTALPLSMPFEPSLSGIEALCREVRRFLGVSDAVVFDYLELLENAGLRIVFCRLPDGIESLSCYDEPNGNAVIVVAGGMNTERQLFHMAYELGRIYCFTQMRQGGVVGRKCGKNIAGKALTPQRMGRAFAGLFLQPAEAVRATVRQLGIERGNWTYGILLRLKHRFGVSAETFLYRLKELRLIDFALAERLKKRIYEDYAKTGNKEPDASHRVLTPNGRLGDLLMLAEARSYEVAEIREIRKRFEELGMWGEHRGGSL